MDASINLFQIYSGMNDLILKHTFWMFCCVYIISVYLADVTSMYSHSMTATQQPLHNYNVCSIICIHVANLKHISSRV